MRLYPAIDLKDGKCVRLLQGDYQAVTVFEDTPAQTAKKWEQAGGRFLHLVDLDGAREGRGLNDQAVKSIIEAINIPVELGGGIRTLEAVEAKLNMGVARVILGSVAVGNPDFVKEAVRRFGPERIVVGVDAKAGKVAVEGWLKVTNVEALTFCQQLEKLGIRTVIYTDIAKDGMMQGPNVEETKRLIDHTGLQIVASGGIARMEDLDAVAGIGVEGAIIGKALYTGAISLEEACRRYAGGGVC